MERSSSANDREELRAANNMITRIYLKGAAFCLIVTALGKVAMVFGNALVLGKPSPLFGFVSNRQMLLLAFGLEIAVAAVVLSRGVPRRWAVASVAWLATVFLAYRAIISISEFPEYCDCLGSLGDALYLSPKAANWIASGILIYLLVGSYGLLIKAGVVAMLSNIRRKRENACITNLNECG
jgi:hypothetical protein